MLFTPRLTYARTAGDSDAAALAAELEQAIADSTGVRAAPRCCPARNLRATCTTTRIRVRRPKLLHAVFLPGQPAPGLAAWVASAASHVRANGSRDEAQVLGRTVYLHTPDGYPRSELRRVLAKAGGPTSAAVAGTARNWATVSRLVKLCAA